MSGRRLALFAVVAALAAGCSEPPALQVDPPRPAPGEPIRVRLAFPAALHRPVPVELHDASGALLAREVVDVDGAAASVVLFPAEPALPGPLRLRARGRPGRVGSAWSALRLALAPGRTRVEPNLLDGFGPEERDGDRRFRWCAPCALAELEATGGDLDLHLRWRCSDPGAHAAIVVGGAAAAALACDGAGPAHVVVRIPRRAWGASVFVPIELIQEPASVPARDAGGEDRRELGLQVFGLVAVTAAGERSR